MISIVALIPTHNRPDLLSRWALASIARQTRMPDYVVIVDDSGPTHRATNRRVADGLSFPGTHVVYLENSRTPGLSGAVNTALVWMQAETPGAFVALLDDDDAWAPNYLERCEEAIVGRDLDMVAAGIVFHGPDVEARHLDSPEELDVDELLVRNPHIQGSNLFVRLAKMLEAGGFDEALVSTTDRDVCIRLADLGTVRYGKLSEYLVHHHAEDDRPRLSSRGSEAKCAGLTRFYRKYRGRMTVEQREAFLKRSRDLFDCDPSVQPALPRTEQQPTPVAKSHERLDLVVGAITSPEVGCVSNLLESLSRELGGRDDVVLKVVLLENGGNDRTSRERLRKVVDSMALQGLDIDLIALEDQRRDAAAGFVDTAEEQLSERKSIAMSRTMLQQYLYWEAKPRPGSVVWILDDDVAMDGLVHDADGPVRSRNVDYAAAISELKGTGYSIVLGEVTGDPPLPILSCVRTQLVDLYHNLHQLATLQPRDPYPDRGIENLEARLETPDYYYDLSRSGTRHLELPFWYQPSRKGITAEQVLSELSSRVAAILAGNQVFRPLAQTFLPNSKHDPYQSTNRGPSTLVFDHQALRDFPNPVPKVDGKDTRRSDMVWSLLNRFAGWRDVVQSSLPVRQERNVAADMDSAFGTLAQDIQGFAVCSAVRMVLERRGERGHRSGGYGFRDLDQEDIEMAMAAYRQSRTERLAAFSWNFVRITGLVSAIARFCVPGSDTERVPWWLSSPGNDESAARLRKFWTTLRATYTPGRLADFRRQVTEVDDATIREYFLNLSETIARHRSLTALPIDGILSEAENHLTQEFGVGPLDCLGIGEEGAIFTDGHLVYKYFHYWKPGTRDRKIEYLKSLAGRLCGYGTLTDIREVRQWGEHVALVYPYEKGRPYVGGHLEDILSLLRECRAAGIACRNIHPDNLLVTPSGLKLIDIGADIVPYDGNEFEHMCRRALLTYRFHFRSDLKALMTRFPG